MFIERFKVQYNKYNQMEYKLSYVWAVMYSFISILPLISYLYKNTLGNKNHNDFNFAELLDRLRTFTTYLISPMLAYISYQNYNVYSNQVKILYTALDELSNGFSKDNRYQNAINLSFLQSADYILTKVNNIHSTMTISPLFIGVLGFRLDHKKSQIDLIKNLCILGHYYCQFDQPNNAYEKLILAKKLCEQLVGIKDNEAGDLKSPDLIAKLASYNLPKKILAGLPEGYSKIYLSELYVSILYTLGRVYFYNKDVNKINEYREYLQRADKICNAIAASPSHVNIFYKLLIQRNGLKYLDLESNEINRIKDAKNYYQISLDNDNQYQENGVPKTLLPIKDNYHRLVCYEQFLRCNTKLIELSEFNIKSLETAIAENQDYIRQLRSLVNQLGDKPVNMGNYLNIIGDYYYSYAIAMKKLPNSYDEVETKQLLDDAENQYKGALRYATIGKPYIEGDACYGLAKVKEASGEFTQALEWLGRCIKISEKIYPNTDQRIQKVRSLYSEILTHRVDSIEEIKETTVNFVELLSRPKALIAR